MRCIIKRASFPTIPDCTLLIYQEMDSTFLLHILFLNLFQCRLLLTADLAELRIYVKLFNMALPMLLVLFLFFITIALKYFECKDDEFKNEGNIEFLRKQLKVSKIQNCSILEIKKYLNDNNIKFRYETLKLILMQ